MSVRIVVDDAELQRVQGMLGEISHKAPNVIANSLNRSISNMNSNITKEVRSKYHIKAGDVKSTLKAFKASPSNLKAEVKSSGKLMGLDKFKVNPKTANPKRKNQLKIAVKKDGIKQVLGSFVAAVNGAKIFTRDGKKRLPISRLMGPSVPQMIGNEENVETIQTKAWVAYQRNLNHYVNHLLSKL